MVIILFNMNFEIELAGNKEVNSKMTKEFEPEGGEPYISAGLSTVGECTL